MTRLWQCYDVGKSINPTLVEGQIEGGAMQGLGLGVLENCYPYYPSVEHRGGQFGAYLAPGMEDLPQIDTIIIENPSADGPYGAKGIGEMANNAQPPAIATAVFDAVGVWVTELPITPERVLRALQAKAAGSGEPRRERQDGRLRRRAVGEHGRHRDHVRSRRLMADSPFRSFNGVEPFPIFPGVGLHPIAGDQVFLGRVTYEPGTTVQRHSHEHTEQAMLVLEGSLTMTIGDESRELGPGDACVVNRGVEHELYSDGRRHVHRGARAGAARPHRRPRARSRPRRPERVAARRAVGRPHRVGARLTARLARDRYRHDPRSAPCR